MIESFKFKMEQSNFEKCVIQCLRHYVKTKAVVLGEHSEQHAKDTRLMLMRKIPNYVKSSEIEGKLKYYQ